MTKYFVRGLLFIQTEPAHLNPCLLSRQCHGATVCISLSLSQHDFPLNLNPCTWLVSEVLLPFEPKRCSESTEDKETEQRSSEDLRVDPAGSGAESGLSSFCRIQR